MKNDKAEQSAQQQEPVVHCEAGPEHCPVCLAETRSLALAAALGYIQRNTPKLVSEEICRALAKIPTPASKLWVGLTEKEHTEIAVQCGCMSDDWVFYGAAVERILKEKNS